MKDDFFCFFSSKNRRQKILAYRYYYHSDLIVNASSQNLKEVLLKIKIEIIIFDNVRIEVFLKNLFSEHQTSFSSSFNLFRSTLRRATPSKRNKTIKGSGEIRKKFRKLRAIKQPSHYNPCSRLLRYEAHYPQNVKIILWKRRVKIRHI